MGSLGNLRNKVKKNLQERMQVKYKLSPDMVYKLFKARDKAFFRCLDELGVSDHGLRDSKGNIDQSALLRRMQLAGVSIKNITEHANPKDNGTVFFKNGIPMVAISQPYIEKGDIHVEIVKPSALISGSA